ncbi:MAG: ABC transporter ATP-binding protein [Planctomycetota bacterium]
MNSIRLENVSKSFDDGIVAVSDINLKVEPGCTVVLAGPSGAGKSTILRLIAGLETPTGGDIYIDGQRVNDKEPRQRDVAMVFQHFALYPHMTVYENMGFALKMQRMPKDVIREKVIRTARMLEIEDLLKRKPCQLSGGQRQRAALGKAIVRKPKIFLFDEPLSNLDPMLRKTARQQIRQILTKLSATAIYVTHDRHEAGVLADRICILNAGRIQQVGNCEEIHKNPANEFVARFFCEE